MRAIAVRCAASAVLLLYPASLLGEATSADVNAAIERGVACLEKLQRFDGGWVEYDSQPGAVTALCTWALLRAGRNANEQENIRKALAYLEKQPDADRTYNASLMIMAFAAADAEKYKPKINKLAQDLASRQMRDPRTKGGWSYKGPNDGNADNSNTHFAMLAIHEAEQLGVNIPDKVWQQAQQYWLQPGMQVANGGFGYGLNQKNSTGSMTCSAISSLIFADHHLQPLEARVIKGNIQCCGIETRNEKLPKAIQWLSDNFTVSRNPNREGSLLYYLWSLEHACELTGQRFTPTMRTTRGTLLAEPVSHDWYREACEFLIGHQDKPSGAWIGTGQMGENKPDVGTAFALLVLSHGRRPVAIARLQHRKGAITNAADWNHHRRALPNLVGHTGRQWGRELAWQTVDFSRWQVSRGDTLQEKTLLTAADLLEFPVLFLSGTQAIDFDAAQRRPLKEYVENGGTLLAEACGDQQTSAAAFDQSFRQLLRELFPGRELTKLPPQHAIYHAQQPIDPAQLPSDVELWGLDICGCTSVVYCPRSLSCYWELAAAPAPEKIPAQISEQIDQVTRLGCNLLTYATRREFKQRLDRPLLAAKNPGGHARPESLVIPMLRTSGEEEEPPTALNYLLRLVESRFAMPVDYDPHTIAATVLVPDKHPVVFLHGRHRFQFSADERDGLKNYLDRGGFLFAAATLSSPEFSDSLRKELHVIYPDSPLAPIEDNHPLLTESFGGFPLALVNVRTLQPHSAGQPFQTQVTENAPRLEGLTVEGRLIAVLSPIDITCALTRGGSVEHETYLPLDAARIGANVILFGLQRRSRLR